jgi:hydroxymethylglutaryl-CoA reductase
MATVRNSRIAGFYKLSVQQRRKVLTEHLDLRSEELQQSLAHGGMDADLADKTVENVVGTYSLPFALTLNVRMNGQDYLAPMAVEEPSVVAAASNAAKIVRAGGGFHAETDEPLMISQVLLDEVPDVHRAQRAIEAHRGELLALANEAIPGLVARGGGARDVEFRALGEGMIAVHIVVDCRDAMGANLVNTVAEAVAGRVAGLTLGKVGLRILSNLADRRKVRVKCRIPYAALGFDGYEGHVVARDIARASRFAEVDPYRAATHNKGIMNGIDAVVMATGNDWRSVEAGAHAYAARDGRYDALCVWHLGEDQTLRGQLELPMALGIVGGPSRVHRGAQFALRAAGVRTAQELGMLAACVGMASNLAALRALATVGIQKGHMALHARSVAIAAGARGEWVEQVAARIHEIGDVTLQAAQRVMSELIDSMRMPTSSASNG